MSLVDRVTFHLDILRVVIVCVRDETGQTTTSKTYASAHFIDVNKLTSKIVLSSIPLRKLGQIIFQLIVQQGVWFAAAGGTCDSRFCFCAGLLRQTFMLSEAQIRQKMC